MITYYAEESRLKKAVGAKVTRLSPVTWYVETKGSESKYTVKWDIEKQVWACNCKDNEHRNSLCKHILAVLLSSKSKEIRIKIVRKS